MSSSSSSSFEDDETLTLIPGLPNDISLLILAFIPYSHYSRIKPTCKSWRSLLSSKTLISLRQSHLNSSQLLCIFPNDPSLSPPYLFDPQNLAWCPLPPMPCNPHAYGLSNFVSIAVESHLYVLGGSLFDTRSFPMNRPSPSSKLARLDVFRAEWEELAPMISPRGSFACAVVPGGEGRGEIVVAGGGSRHPMFGAAGSRMSLVEKYDIEKDEWVALDVLPRFRAGCVGYLVGKGAEMEFWVMGGYGSSRTVSGVFPVDEYYRDGVVLELKNGGKWRGVGDMWEEGERRRLGNVVVVNGNDGDLRGIFMLDGSDIFRYDISCNRWLKESNVPRKAHDDSSFGFVALNEELHVLSSLKSVNSSEIRRPQIHKRGKTLLIQIYDPKRRTWRSLRTKPPFHCPLDFKTAVMSTIRL
ncbi:hypothetical protein GIB67_028093 [Kingdonia uniflora]|uniref:F-box domain-containing protein n=1 Tax=Kingdonia uniflora TaxID=39325 RepID=A0A7J7NRF6_9MAGN|nr:hypothetical protein GIB67_028093 [Kingdonia uniflora]